MFPPFTNMPDKTNQRKSSGFLKYELKPFKLFFYTEDSEVFWELSPQCDVFRRTHPGESSAYLFRLLALLPDWPPSAPLLLVLAVV